MLKVVLTSNSEKALKIACAEASRQRWAVVDADFCVKDALIREGIEVIALQDVLAQNEVALEKEYVENIAELSYLDSVAWWANNLSEKNEHLSTFYSRLCFFYGAIKTLERLKSEAGVILVVADPGVVRALASFCRANSFDFFTLDNALASQVRSWIQRLKEFLKICRYLFGTLVRKVCIEFSLRRIIDSELLPKKEVYGIRTWLDRRFLERDLLRQDAYFGRLPEFLRNKGQNIVFIVGILDKFRDVIRRIKESSQAVIIPEECFLSLGDFLFLIGQLFSGRLQIKKKIYFGGAEATELYREELRSGQFAESFVRNVLSYRIAQRFSQQLDLKVYAQTFENFAWEKLTIRGIRSVNAQVPILGFQHAFISRNSFKYFPGRAEKDLIPLPTKIITLGQRTKAIMQQYGCYNGQTQLLEGCALRQEYIGAREVIARQTSRQVLVPLTMVKKEVFLMLEFLTHANLEKANIKILIRPHPATSFEHFITEEYLSRYDHLKLSRQDLQQELQQVDAVLYTWSTVAVEALKLGLPVIYLDILRPMYVDPLFECTHLKRSVSDPQALAPMIESLYALSSADFKLEQAAAQRYLQEYFGPVNEERLSAYLV